MKSFFYIGQTLNKTLWKVYLKPGLLKAILILN